MRDGEINREMVVCLLPSLSDFLSPQNREEKKEKKIWESRSKGGDWNPHYERTNERNGTAFGGVFFRCWISEVCTLIYDKKNKNNNNNNMDDCLPFFPEMKTLYKVQF